MAFVSAVFICHRCCFFLFLGSLPFAQLPFTLMVMKMATNDTNVILPRNLMNSENCKDVDDIWSKALKLYVFEELTVICQASNIIQNESCHVLFSWNIAQDAVGVTNFQSVRINSVIKLGTFFLCLLLVSFMPTPESFHHCRICSFSHCSTKRHRK